MKQPFVKEHPVAESNETPNDTPETAAPAASQRQQRPQIQVDDSKANVAYANFCRVTGTPEELILDFGLNPQPFGIPPSRSRSTTV